MSPSMWLILQLLEYRHWSSQLCTWSDLNFVSIMSVNDWNSGIRQHCSQPQKNHDYGCAGIKLSLSVRVSRWTKEFTCRVQHVMTNFYWPSAMSIKLPRICSLFSLVKISWYSWHFAALVAIVLNHGVLRPGTRNVVPSLGSPPATNVFNNTSQWIISLNMVFIYKILNGHVPEYLGKGWSGVTIYIHRPRRAHEPRLPTYNVTD